MADIGLTPAERNVVSLLRSVWNEYLALPVEHPTERAEFCAAIHRCQDMVLSRTGRRQFDQAEVNSDG
ncbi:hypothetical protein L0Y47_21415 [Ectopseudomonas composti]